MENLDKLYEYLAIKYNFSNRQTGWFFEFCDKDLNKLETLLFTLNSNLKLKMPVNKKEVENLLN